MNKFIKLLSVLVLIAIGSAVNAQKISNKGKDFWVGYGHHQFMEAPTDNSQNMTLYMSVEDLPAGVPYATVTVTIDSSGLTPALWWKRTYRIPKNTVISLDNSATPAFSFSPATTLSWGALPKGAVDAGPSHTSPGFDCRLYTDPCPAGTGGFGVFRKKAIHITSDYEIVAYSHIYGSVSSGATMLLPTTSWGYSYTTINSRQANANDSYNFFYVLAQENNTRIKITASNDPRSNASCTFAPPPKKTPFFVTLQKGQIFQYVGQANAAGDGVQLTGSKVESVPNSLGQCKKIAVFSGSSRTAGENHGGCTSGGRDNDMVQCFPEHTWGRRYLTTPFGSANSATNITANDLSGASYKIVCADTGTRVRINGGAPINIIRDSFYQFTNAIPNYIESNKAIMVGQFMTSSNCGGGLGDPDMIYLSPLEQAIPQVGLYRNTQESINAQFVNIVVPDAGYNSLKIDNQGAPLFGGNSYTLQIPNYAGNPGLSGYKMVIKGWPATKSQTIVKCDTSFNIITYGMGGAESYGYNGGAYFNNLKAVSAVYNTNDTTKNIDSASIKGHNQAYYSNQIPSPVNLRLITGNRVSILSWNFSQTIDTNKVTIVNSRTGFANKNVVDYHPKPIDSSQVNGKWTNFKYQCPDTMQLYLKTFNGTIPPFKIDTFYVPVTIHEIDSVALYTAPVSSCSGSFGSLGDTVLLQYNAAYGGGISIVANIPPCLTQAATFSGPDSVNYGVVKERIVKWFWEFEDGTTSTQQNPTHLLTLPINLIQLTVTTSNGLKAIVSTLASASTTIKFSAPERVCVNQPITVIDSTVWTNKDSCIWNFGDGTRIIDVSCKPQTHTYTTPGTYIIWHKLTLGGSPCVLDSVPKTIIVANKRYPVIEYTNPCGDTSGVSNFNANFGTGGVPIKNYLWNFGHPSSGTADTSTFNPPTHKYDAEGNYVVKVNIVDSLGCLGDTTQTIAIRIKPNIYFNPLGSICENATTVSFASKAGCYNQSKVFGAGVFKGNGVDATGNFNPSLAGYGTHVIWYVYTSGSGCADSLSQSIVVFAKPRANFDYTKGCLPKTGEAQFSNLSTIAAGYSLGGFTWNFDDAANSTSSNPNVNDTAVNPSHFYTNTGTYNVKLIDTSADGCISDTTITITFSVTPSVNFAPLTSVCENATNVNVALATVNNNVLGTGSYFGNGTTNAGILSPAISGWGNQHITYIFTSTGNCIDSASQDILVKARPRISFTYPAGCLPSSGVVNFTDYTSLPDGQTIQNCGWTFGDPNATVGNPNAAIICSPSHTYNYGTYTIYHTVTSSLGCVTDTTFTTTFSISPQLYYNAIADVCENVTSYSVATAGSNNLTAAPGSGVYQGVGIVNGTTGEFNPSVAGAGTHKIYYEFTATSGCVTKDSQTVVVKPRPSGMFTFTPNSGCLNATGTVQFDASAIAIAAPASITTYNWQFETPSTIVNGVNTTHDYNDGTYLISLNVQANNGCSLDTSITQTFSKTPALSPLVQLPICENGGIVTLVAPTVTNGALGTGAFSSFKSAITNATTGTYDPSISGYGVDTIYYTFTTGGGCSSTVKSAITINAKPIGSFSFTPASGCLNTAGTVQFSGSGVTVPNSFVQTYNWQFETPSTIVNGASPTHNYNDGTYLISLNAVGANGCSADFSMSQAFSKTPALAPIVQADVCENGGVITLVAPAVTNGAVGSGVFSSFKNAVTNATTGTYDPSIAGYGIDTIYYNFTSTGGCIAQRKLAIRINAKPRGTFSFNPNTGCLDVTGLVKLNGNGVTVPGSFVQTYNWQFENTLPYANVGATPSHSYNDGTYDIRLIATGFNGCADTFTIQKQFSRTPSLDPIVLANVCANSTAFTLTPPAVNNGVVGPTGIFTSFKNAVTGTTYDPVVAGFSFDTVYYTFVSDRGCAATVKKVINVFPVPTAKIDAKANLCLDSTTRFYDLSTLATGNIATRTWDFGDGTASIVNPVGNVVVKGFANLQTYLVKLTITSDSSCTAMDSTYITTRAKPIASFEVNPIVCMPSGTAYFTNKSVLASNSGTLNYAWTFGDPSATAANPNTSNQTDPKHTYNNIQSSIVRLVVTSIPYNCQDVYYDTLNPQAPFFMKPIAKFGIDKDTLCQNEISLFTDSSFAPNSSLFSWTWNYGDGSTPNTTTVPYSSYNYPVSGTFSAALTVRNTELCESDPFVLNVLVYPQPQIDSMKEIVVLQNTMVQFNPTVNDTVSIQYWWTSLLPPFTVQELSKPDTLYPYFNAVDSKVYVLNALGLGGCSAQKYQSVKVLGNIAIPNAFSPNSDGKNDTWDITSLGEYPGASVEIFDRYGYKVKSLSGANIKWDGTRNGVPVPIGTYYYIINPGFKLGKITGWVVVLR